MAIIKFSILIVIILISICCSGCFKAPDSDGDGHRDPVDAFPDDPIDWKDSDNDGIGDNAEIKLGTNPHNSDTDGDNHTDGIDLDPLNASIGIDSDGDGYHDAVDAFPQDPGEWIDTDGDSHGDNSDKYPDEPLYHTSISRSLSDYSFEEIERVTVYKNERSGTEYIVEVTNNEPFGSNFTVTVSTCNAEDWTKKDCIPGTYVNASATVYIDSGKTETAKVNVFSEYMKQVRTFKYWINVTSSEVEQPV